MSATVIIPTTGSPDLQKAVESVLSQTYPTTCYIVIDGDEYHERVLDRIIPINPDLKFDHRPNINFCTIPENVGANGYYGHRIYAAFTHLVNTEYVLYLDQDNWYERNHVENCIKAIEDTGVDWSYSLRNIYDKTGEYICKDDSESLGKWNPIHDYNHIDTSCYCLKTEVAIKICNSWHGGWGQDRVFYSNLSENYPEYVCTGDYTLNYRLAGNAGSVQKNFFIQSNSIVYGYNKILPWRKDK